MNRNRSLLVLSALCAASVLEAQAPPPPRVVGLTLGPAVVVQDPFTCQVQPCLAGFLPPAMNPFAGGTAHDAGDGATWITNGLQLAKVDVRNQCQIVCPPQPIPLPAAAAFATGLAYTEQTRTLWVSYSTNQIGSFTVQGCQLLPQVLCVAPVAAGHMVTAIATDDLGGSIFYASSPAPGGPAFGIVFQAPIAAPCAPFCRYTIPGCAGALLPQITGLGFEPCRSILYATDGPTLVGTQILPNCQQLPVNCCVLPFAAPYVGLDVLPSHGVPFNPSCTQGACPVCPGLRHDTVGDATVGNNAFALSLKGAPANSLAILILSIGAHCSGPGIPLFFCAPIFTPAPFATFGAFPTGGGVGCTGGVLFPLALPGNPALCGLPMSSQWVGICPGNPLVDNFTSNCLSWTITGS